MRDHTTKARLLNSEDYAVEWRARWLQNPCMYGQKYHHPIEYLREIQFATARQNIHTFYRKKVLLHEAPIQYAHLYVTADDVYKLYFNGDFVNMGPAQSLLCDYHYNALDVTNYFAECHQLTIAAHVYYQGLLNLAYLSADNLEGFLFQLEILYQDGTRQHIVSDGSWKYFPCEAWKGERTFGYTTQFSEDIDMRKIPYGWKLPDFDDHAWPNALVAAFPYPMFYHMTPQITPPLSYVEKLPQAVTETSDGRYLLDFGTELTGFTILRLKGTPGQIVEVRHAEELIDTQHIRFDARCYCRYQEFITLSGQMDEIEFFDYKGFRYMELVGYDGPLSTDSVSVINSFYPMDDKTCLFHSSEPLLNDIWDICRNGVKQGTQDTYLDCPTREKGGFLGDAYITAFSHLYLSNDDRILKKMLCDFANKLRIYPGMTVNAPNYIVGDLADYTLLWPEILLRYFIWTGDLSFVREMRGALDTLCEYFEGFEDTHGFLAKIRNRLFPESESILVDWPPNVRYDYDFEAAKNGVCTLINQLYFGFLRTCATLYSYLGETPQADRLQQKAAQLDRNCAQYLFDQSKNLFLDVLGGDHAALHANPVALFFQMRVPGGYDSIAKFIQTTGLRCGVYYAYFIIQGLYNTGYADLAYSLITSQDENSWSSMIKAGATTCMEVWAPDLKDNTSWCHPWSSSPILFTVEDIMGLSAASPGWNSIFFRPHIPATLQSASLRLTTPAGKIDLSFKQHHRQIDFLLKISQKNTFIFEFDSCNSICVVDDTPLNFAEYCTYPSKYRAFKTLSAGTHRIRLLYSESH